MKVAIPIWSGRVSTVFDFAHRLLLVEFDGSDEMGRSELPLHGSFAIMRAKRLSHLGVEVLICGAISRPLARMVASQGIEIIPFISGTVSEVLNAYLNGQLADPRFCLPGCRPGAGRHRQKGHCFHGGRENRK
ncbi:MAG: hypothetical protein GQ559_04625 [Desulfobulbaceae bacterium]|nr:hypothetical protein [Desulfobulbaceae bacterium]